MSFRKPNVLRLLTKPELLLRFLKQKSNGQPDVARARHPAAVRSSYEKMRPVPQKARFRCALPQYMERPLVGSCSVLFGSLRSHL